MSTQLHGTWRWVKQIDRCGNEDTTPMPAPPNYTFNPDGSASFNLPSGPKVPMGWKIVDGRLQIKGARGEKGQSTLRFEMPDAGTLVLFDRYERRGVFERVPDADPKEGWIVRIARGCKRVDYEDGKQTCRFDAEFEQGRWLIHAYRWTGADGSAHESTSEIRSQIIPRIVDYLHMGGWKGRVDVISEPSC